MKKGVYAMTISAGVAPELVLLSAPALEEELIRLSLLSAKNPTTADKEGRRRRFARYHGLDGRGGATLQEVADEERCTKERVRQLCNLRYLSVIPARPSTPFLEKALTIIATLAPDRTERIEAELQRQGLTKGRVALEKIVEFAEALGLAFPFTVDGVSVLRAEQKALGRITLGLARKYIRRYGAAMLSSVAEGVARETGEAVDAGVVGRIVQAAREFAWLDEASGWFWFTDAQNSLLNDVKKVLSVAGHLSAGKLRTCIQRDANRGKRRRMMIPPAGIIEELCRQAPGFRVDQGSVAADLPLDWRQLLQGEEKKMVELFHEHGPVIRHEDLEEYRIRYGIQRTTFYQYLSRLPVICKYGRGIYGLQVSTVTAGRIEALREQRREAAPPLVEGVWMADNMLRLTYRLTLSQVYGGALPVPSRFYHQLKGAFTLSAGQYLDAGLKIKNHFCWGFGRLFRQRKAEPGDLLILTFNLVNRTATIHLQTALNVASGACLDPAEG